MQGINPLQIIGMIKNGQNPQSLMMSLLEKNMGGTPMGDNLIKMARGGQTADIEKFARNFFESKIYNNPCSRSRNKNEIRYTKGFT